MTDDPKTTTPPSASKRPNRRASPRSSASSRSFVAAPPRAAMREDTIRRKKPTMKELLGTRHPKSNKLPSPAPDDAPPPVPNNSASTSANSVAMADDAQKYDRVADLERALNEASDEISKLKQHIDLLKSNQGAHSEPIKTSDLTSAPKQEDPEFQMEGVQLEVDDEDDSDDSDDDSSRDTELFDLRSKVQMLEADLLEQDDMWKARWERERSDRMHERNAMAEELHSTQKEALDRRKQLLELKQSLSSLTHRENQVTDGDLSERMDGLYHRIREWVVSNLRRSQPDFTQLSETTKANLVAVMPGYLDLNPRLHKINIYQALIMANMIEIFSHPHCFGLPSHGPLSQVETVANLLERPSPEYRKWHSSTVDLVISTLGPELEEQTKHRLFQIADTTLNLLYKASGIKLSPPSQKAFEAILSQAVQISRLFRVQIPEYRAYLPRSPLFDPATMEMVDEQDEDMGQSSVMLFVSPCIEKISDESGLDTKPYAVTKARVVCAPFPTE